MRRHHWMASCTGTTRRSGPILNNLIHCPKLVFRIRNTSQPRPAGAGDQFAAGFLYGVMRGYSTRKCAQLGCLAGGAVVQVVGAEMTPDSWRWVFARSAL